MARDFIAILAGPHQLAVVLLASVDSALIRAGFSRAPTVHREDLEGVLAPPESEQEVKLESSVLEATEKLLLWNAASLEFWKDDLQLQVIVARWSAGFTNTFVRVDLRLFEQLRCAGELHRYYELLALVADATGATAGYAATEPELGPVSPDAARTSILANILGLLPAVVPQSDVAGLAGAEYLVHQVAGWWILADKEYLGLHKDS